MPRTASKAEDTDAASCDHQDKKRLRNRLAQQAFRRRQAEYVRQLRDRLDSDEVPQDVVISQLRRENHRLRKQLVEVQSKLDRITATIGGVSGSITTALEKTPRDQQTDEQGQITESVSWGSSPSDGQSAEESLNDELLLSHFSSFNPSDNMATTDLEEYQFPITDISQPYW